MTPLTIILIVLGLTAVAVITALVDRWSHRKRLLGRAFGNDDQHQIDIIRRGQVCPWPTEGE